MSLKKSKDELVELAQENAVQTKGQAVNMAVRVAFPFKKMEDLIGAKCTIVYRSQAGIEDCYCVFGGVKDGWVLIGEEKKRYVLQTFFRVENVYGIDFDILDFGKQEKTEAKRTSFATLDE